MQSQRHWSLTSKRAQVTVWGGLCVLIIACVLQGKLSAPKQGPSKQVSSIPIPVLPTAGLYDTAPINPRRQIAVRLGASGPTAKQDDHWGECAAFSHYHPTINELGYPQYVPQPYEDGRWALPLDGLCHDDVSDKPIGARPKLPKPQYVPNKKAIWV
jgi:hypothetical protein